MESATPYPLIIIGSGPAGLTAALYAARSGITPLVLEGDMPGGQLVTTTYVENWPGEEKILGPLLMRKLHDQATKCGVQFSSHSAVAVNLHNTPFSIQTNKQRQLTCNALILAMGAVANRLGCPGEQTYWGKGVHTCAICDGALYKNEAVVIVGGGDSAAEKASFMAQLTDKVTIIHQQTTLTSSPAMQQRVLNNPHITVLYNHTVQRINGDERAMNEVVVHDHETNQAKTIKANALFLAIGSRPNTDLVKNQLDIMNSGHIVVHHPSSKTSIAGVFACGDVSDPIYRQAITAAGSGCIAALDALDFLQR